MSQMTQSNENEMPDVMFIDPSPSDFRDREDIDLGGCWPASEKHVPGDIKYIRHGAQTPWIDPKVQPIPEGLQNNIYAKYELSGDIRVETVPMWLALSYEQDGALLGYIILPE